MDLFFAVGLEGEPLRKIRTKRQWKTEITRVAREASLQTEARLGAAGLAGRSGQSGGSAKATGGGGTPGARRQLADLP